MDLQTCLKNTLKNKYQKLGEAYYENSFLPSRLCYRDIRQKDLLADMHKHEFCYVHSNCLQSWIALPTVPLTDILSCDCKHSSSKRTVITVGVSGVGKTTAVQRCALEWAEGKEYHHIHLLFVLTFWELNLLKQNKLSLIELLQTFYSELQDLDANVGNLNKNNVWFVVDGLDEYNLPLNFSSPIVTDVSEVSTVDVLVTNLIMGNLLSNAHVWITTRYAAASRIPNLYLLKETEVQWFSEQQMEQHFRTIIGDDDLANKAIDQVKVSRSLDFLYLVPSICTIMANVFKNHLKPNDGLKLSPVNLTQIYTLLVKASNSDFINKLKKLALLEILKRNVEKEKEMYVFYKDDFVLSDISVEEASTFSKEFPLLWREEKGLYNTTVFRFGHWSIQHYLSASANLEYTDVFSRSRCFQYFVDEGARSVEGTYDVFLRFIFGLIREHCVLEPTDELFEYTKKKILECSSVTLYYCLREYDSLALLNEVKFFRKYGISPIDDIASKHFKVFIKKIRFFQEMYKTFQMQVSARCDERLLRELPAVLDSRMAM